MKRLLLALTLGLFATAATAQVGVSVTIGQPGFYGTIELGDYYPRPEVVYAEPVIVQRRVIVEEPLYLRVPPPQINRWSRYCGRYNACGRRVYFVRDSWYNDVYAPAWREHHGKRGNGRWDRDDRGDWRGNNGRGNNDRWDDDRGHHGHKH